MTIGSPSGGSGVPVLSSPTNIVRTWNEPDVRIARQNALEVFGKAELITAETVDDFENGVDSSWTGDTGSLTAQTGTVLTETQSGEFTSSNQDIEVAWPYVTLSSDTILNDGSDTVTITVSVREGIEIARNYGDPKWAVTDASLVEVTGEATIEIDGQPMTVSLTDGVGEKPVRTDPTTISAGDSITVQAVSLADHPATESKPQEIQVEGV